MFTDLPLVCDFPEMFLYDLSDFIPEGEVKFAIDLVTGTNYVSTTPYWISSLELSELKKQLEDLLEKKDGSMRLCVDYR